MTETFDGCGFCRKSFRSWRLRKGGKKGLKIRVSAVQFRPPAPAPSPLPSRACGPPTASGASPKIPPNTPVVSQAVPARISAQPTPPDSAQDASAGELPIEIPRFFGALQCAATYSVPQVLPTWLANTGELSRRVARPWTAPRARGCTEPGCARGRRVKDRLTNDWSPRLNAVRSFTEARPASRSSPPGTVRSRVDAGNR